MPRVKVKVTMRQIDAAREKMTRKIDDIRRQFTINHPAPSYETEEAWKLKNPSPMAKHRALIDRTVKPLRDKMEEIIYQARMEMITDDELFAKVNKF